MSTVKTPVGVVIAFGFALHVFAQAPVPTDRLAFEVASIKLNKSGVGPVGAPGDRFSNGQFRTTNIPLRLLMRQAFQRMQTDEIEGGPAWLDTDRWDITAKAESPAASMLPMIRTLLAERFKLTTHHETKERPVYALVMARRDGRLGPSLHPSTGQGQNRQLAGAFTARATPFKLLVDVLAAAVQQRVIDRTGLSGTYDIDLHWTPAATPLQSDSPSSAAAAATPSDAPSIFTAVQEQLGLKLDSTRAPVDVLVIDQVERPTEN
jgi:uncharacterized protein (TIGR03435 family)